MGFAPVVGGEACRFLELHLQMAAGEATCLGNGFVGIFRMGNDELLGFLQAQVGEPDAEGLSLHLAEILHEQSLGNVQSCGEQGAVEVRRTVALLRLPVGDEGADALFLLVGQRRLHLFHNSILASLSHFVHLCADNLVHAAYVEAKGNEADHEEEHGD